MSSVEEICQKSAGLSIDFLEAGLDVQRTGVMLRLWGQVGGGHQMRVFLKLT